MIAGVVLISVITVPDRDLLDPAILTLSTDYELVREQPFHMHTTFLIRPAESISMNSSKKYDVILRSWRSWSLAVSADPLAWRQKMLSLRESKIW
jgi:hypothetical protein